MRSEELGARRHRPPRFGGDGALDACQVAPNRALFGAAGEILQKFQRGARIEGDHDKVGVERITRVVLIQNITLVYHAAAQRLRKHFGVSLDAADLGLPPAAEGFLP